MCKNIKRLVAYALIVALALSSVPLPLPVTRARGEGAASGGNAPATAYALSEQRLGATITQGVWQYALREDGYAVITGYGGDETDVAVPATLDGINVVGLAGNAFVDDALHTITLHGNILWIAQDAFGRQKPTICAMNGTYGLYYAAGNQHRYINTSKYELTPNVIDFSDALAGRIKRRGEDYVSINALEAQRLNIGSIFWIKDARGIEYFYRVTALEHQGDSVLVTVEIPEVEDAIINMHMEQTIQLSTDDFIPAQGVTVVPDAADTKDRTTDTKKNGINVVLSPGVSSSCKIDSYTKNKFSLNLSVSQTGKVKYVIDVVNGQMTACEETETITSKVSLKLDGSGTFTPSSPKNVQQYAANTQANESSGFDIRIDIGKYGIPLGTFGALSISVKFGISIRGSLTASYVATSSETKSYDFTNKKWDNKKTNGNGQQDTSSFSVDAELSGKIYISASASLSIFYIAHVAEVSAEAGIKFGVKAPVLTTDHNNIPCVVLTMDLYLKIEMYMGAWINAHSKDNGNSDDISLGLKLKVFSTEFNLSEGLRSNVNTHLDESPLAFHLSLDYGLHRQEDCPYSDRCTVKFNTKTSLLLPSVSVFTGDSVPIDSVYSLDDDSTNGAFLGWATKPSLMQSDWTLGDAQYLVEDDMTLYAVWSNAVEVAFNTDGGNDIETQYIPVGGYACQPSTPLKEGSVFEYWYHVDDSGNSTLWNFNEDTVPQNGVTLMAKWDNGVEVTGGTQAVSYIGDVDSVRLSDYADTQTGTEWFDFDVVHDPNGKAVGVTITAIKGDPVNLVIPKELYVSLSVSLEGIEFLQWLPVVDIREDIFRDKTSLKSVKYAAVYDDSYEVNLNRRFSGCSSLEYVDLSNVAIRDGNISSYAFSDCTSLKCVVLPKGVGRISSRAFSACTALERAILADGIKVIEPYAFIDCNALTELYLPDSLEEIGTIWNGGTLYGPFNGCTAIRKISIGGVESLTEGMLTTDSSVLEELEIRGSIRTIGYGVLRGRYKTSTAPSVKLIIGEGVVNIGMRAFELGCFTEVVLPSSLLSIDRDAFLGCEQLKQAKGGENVTHIGRSAFDGCIALETVDLGMMVQSVEYGAFRDCGKLQSIEFGDQLQAIEEAAFQNCTSLKSVEFGNGIETIGQFAFNKCSALTELYLPDSLEEIGTIWNGGTLYGPFNGCTAIRKISIGGVESLTEGMLTTDSSVLEELEIRGSIRTIGTEVLGGRYKTSTAPSVKLIIGEGVENIGMRAFEFGCFTEVILPDSLTDIGHYAFGNCAQLTHLSIGKNIKLIGTEAFRRCPVLVAYLTQPDDYVTEYLTADSIPYVVNNVPWYPAQFDGNGGLFADGAASAQVSIAWNASMKDVEQPVNGDKVFSGWFCDAQCVQRFAYDRMPSMPVSLYAGWDIGLHTVHLDLMGGTLDTAPVLRLAAGARIDLSAVIPDGGVNRIFMGWYQDGSFTRPYSTVMPDRDVTVYARWGVVSLNGQYRIEQGKATLVRYELIDGEQTSVCLPDTVQGCPVVAIAANAFAGEGITQLYLPDTVTAIAEKAFLGMDRLETIVVGARNSAYTAVDGVLYSKALTSLICFPSRRSTRYALPDTVTGIAPYALCDSILTTFIWNDAVTAIEESAFENTRLTELMLPESVASIGRNAFYGCHELALVKGSAAIESIGEYAFEGGALLMVYGPEEDCAIKAYAAAYRHLYNYYWLTLDDGSNTSTQMLQAGAALELPTALELGDNLHFTGWYTTKDCDVLWSGVMPDAALTLYAGTMPVFAYDTVVDEATSAQSLRLTSYLLQAEHAVIPASINGMAVSSVAAGCFTTPLSTLTIPDSVIDIEDGAIAHTDGLVIICSEGSAANAYALEHHISVNKPEFLIRYETNGGAPIADQMAQEGMAVMLPTPLRDGYAFSGWYTDAKLTTAAVLEDGAWSMIKGNATLYADWTLTDAALATLSVCYRIQDGYIVITGAAGDDSEVVIPESINGLPVRQIEPDAFAYSSELVSVRIAGTVATIPDGAFSYCPKLASVTIGEGVSVLAAESFSACRSLEQLTLPQSLTRIESRALSNTSLTLLQLPTGLSYLAADALSGCNKLAALTVAPDNAFYEAVDGVLYDLVDDSLVKYPAAREGSVYTVREGVYAIGEEAFINAVGLETVVLPDTIWSLGKGAFEGCYALTQLPDLQNDRLTSISEACFSGCYRLAEVSVPANITRIEARAFAACSSLTCVTIPETVTTIGFMSFTTSGMVMNGVMGSAAEAYANENGITFYDPDRTRLPQSIALSDSTLSLIAGETHRLSAVIMPENCTLTDVAWYSTDPSVASVSDDGLVHALAQGKADIYACTQNGVATACTVEAVMVGVYPSQAGIYMDESLCLTTDIDLPAEQITWISSNSHIAKVDNAGVVTPVRIGRVIVFARGASGIGASAVVDVLPYASTMVVDAPTEPVRIGFGCTLAAHPSPETHTPYTVTWSLMDDQLASITPDGVITFHYPGTVTVCVASSDRCVGDGSFRLTCDITKVLTLPDALVTIDSEAFCATAAERIFVPSGVDTIGARAFADCPYLCQIVLPDSVSFIADDAFVGSPYVVIMAREDSYAINYARQNDMPYVFQ